MYLLDSDVLIQAKNRHYGFDFCPAFWAWIDEACGRGLVFRVDKVGSELAAGNDELSVWAATRPNLFLKPDGAVLSSQRVVSSWASSGRYIPAAVNSFYEGADYFLVAHAHAHMCIVVTHEQTSTSPNRIKVPDACAGLSVKTISPFEMLKLAI